LSILEKVLDTRWPMIMRTTITTNIVANQPGAGQESTGDNEDDEAEDFIRYQVEEER
jgi:hypothetical protein